MQLIEINSEVTMTSLELVKFICEHEQRSDLTHANFMAKVPKVLGSGGVIQPNDTYINEQNGVEYPMYRFKKREACLMAMSYSYDLQAKVFDRMTELESKQAPAFALPKTMAEALRLAADQAEQLEAQRPAVEFVNRYTIADSGSKGFREVCKLLKANESVFRTWLIDSKIMYRLGGVLMGHQNHIDAGRFEVKAGEANGHSYNACKFTPKGVVWVAGEWAKHQVSIK